MPIFLNTSPKSKTGVSILNFGMDILDFPVLQQKDDIISISSGRNIKYKTYTTILAVIKDECQELLVEKSLELHSNTYQELDSNLQDVLKKNYPLNFREILE